MPVALAPRARGLRAGHAVARRHHAMSLRFFPALPVAAALALTGTLACGGSHEPATNADGSLPPYTPEAAVLFDDAIAPAVFGFDPEGRAPARDPHIKERTRVADFVVP